MFLLCVDSLFRLISKPNPNTKTLFKLSYLPVLFLNSHFAFLQFNNKLPKDLLESSAQLSFPTLVL